MSDSTTYRDLLDAVSSLVPIGYACGQPVWPIFGSASEDEEDDSEEESDDNSEEDEEEDSEEEGEKEKAKKKKGKKKARPADDEDEEEEEDEPVYTESEYQKLRRRMKAADKNRARAEKELLSLQSNGDGKKKGSEGDSELRTQLTTATQERDEARGLANRLAVTNAFLMETQRQKVNWINPKQALRVGQDYFAELDVEEDGEVVGMVRAVKRLAKENPNLIRPEEPEDDDEDEDEETDRKKRPSGSLKVGNAKRKKRGNKKDFTPEEIAARLRV